MGVWLVIALPAFLPLGAAIVVFSHNEWKRTPRLLTSGSLLLLAVTWVAMAVYWWEEVCWETWQPCEGRLIMDLGGYVLIGSLAASVLGAGWLLALRFVGRRDLSR